MVFQHTENAEELLLLVLEFEGQAVHKDAEVTLEKKPTAKHL